MDFAEFPSTHSKLEDHSSEKRERDRGVYPTWVASRIGRPSNFPHASDPTVLSSALGRITENANEGRNSDGSWRWLMEAIMMKKMIPIRMILTLRALHQRDLACVLSVKLNTNKRKRARMVNRVRMFLLKRLKLLNNNAWLFQIYIINTNGIREASFINFASR